MYRCFYKKETLQEHNCYFLGKNTEEKLEFDWIVPISGLLHLEMNGAKLFLKLNWIPFLSSIGYVLGFQSPKAQQYLRKGSDHHKTWHFLEITYVSLGLELVVPYFKEEISNGGKPSCDGYWEWSATLDDSNYIYIGTWFSLIFIV